MTQQKLIEVKNSHTKMKKWSNLCFSQFVWSLYTKKTDTLFKNTTRDHIIRAIEIIKSNGILKGRRSHGYYIKYDGFIPS